MMVRVEKSPLDYLQPRAADFHLEQNTVSKRTGQLDSDFLSHSPTGHTADIPAQRAKPE
jgi:hypothetical protein